jgi:hypothetical protein
MTDNPAGIFSYTAIPAQTPGFNGVCRCLSADRSSWQCLLPVEMIVRRLNDK